MQNKNRRQTVLYWHAMQTKHMGSCREHSQRIAEDYSARIATTIEIDQKGTPSRHRVMATVFARSTGRVAQANTMGRPEVVYD